MASVESIKIALDAELLTQRNDALYALQSLIEYVNALPHLSSELQSTDWTLEGCLKAARDMREYKAA
jgi:hypothetical protein